MTGVQTCALPISLGEEVAVGVLLTVGRYVAHAVVSNTLELRPPVEGVLPPADAAVVPSDAGAGAP